MLTVNLLPEEKRKRKGQSFFKKIDLSGLDLAGLPVARIAAAFTGFLAVILFAVLVVGFYTDRKYASLAGKYNELLPKDRQADLLKADAATINAKIGAIDALMVKRFSWASKFNSLSDSVTPGVWLSELSYDERMPAKAPAPKGQNDKLKKGARGQAAEKPARYLVLNGYTSRMGEEGAALVGKFIKGLKDNSSFYSDFSDIALGSIRSDRIGDQEVMNFTITCLFRET